MSDLGITGKTHPFSWTWVFIAAGVITVAELAIALALAPAVLTGRLASPMLQMRLQMIMHLASFYAGGLAIGVISPGIRLKEPAVGAALSVFLVMLMGIFMPMRFFEFSLMKMALAGGIAAALAASGAFTGERLMGNVRGQKADERTRRLGTGSGLEVPTSSSFTSNIKR